MPSIPLPDRARRLLALVVLALAAPGAAAAEKTPWLLGHATKLPSEYTNQESGYFSLVAGRNDRLYIGSAKYGVNAYLLEFHPKTGKVTKLAGRGFASQAKIHTRNNVDASGTISKGCR
jgi:hypothetical protein